jgi:hypothetical protein
VVSLYPGVEQIVLGGPGTNGFSGASTVATVGKPYGTWYVISPETDDQGRTVIDTTTGMPVIAAKPNYFGSYQPKYIMGVSSELSYKGLRFSFTFDHREGGTMYSRTKDIQEFVGTSPNTVTDGKREDFVIPNSVYAVEDGNGNVTYKENTSYKVHHQDYFIDQSNQATNLIDAGFTKLREVTLSYALPESMINKTFFGNIEVGIFGRNVALWTPAENTYIDPEVSSMGNGNAQGYEYGAIPPIRTWGGQLRVTF